MNVHASDDPRQGVTGPGWWPVAWPERWWASRVQRRELSTSRHASSSRNASHMRSRHEPRWAPCSATVAFGIHLPASEAQDLSDTHSQSAW